MKHLCLLFIMVIFSSQTLYGQVVQQVRGQNVLINLQGKQLKVGEKLDLLDKQGRKRGEVTINRLNPNRTRAIGRVISGTPQQGWTVGKETSKVRASSQFDRNKKISYGAIIGFSLDSMKVTIPGETVNLSGSGFSIKGALDFVFSEKLQIRGRSGMEKFNATGDSSVTEPCAACEVDINYFTLEAMGQYYLSRSKYSFWLGAGGTIAHPLSSSSNAINAGELSTTSALQIGLGMDIRLANAYIPIEFMYSMLPKSDSVTPSYMTFSFGYMF